MNNVELQLNNNGKGTFSLKNSTDEIGKMEIGIKGNLLTVYHTEVDEDFEGQGLAMKLLTSMADYARHNSLKVVPLCSFVHARFREHAQEYEDIWQK
jgi:predicted GNAT family acetyltransferase